MDITGLIIICFSLILVGVITAEHHDQHLHEHHRLTITPSVPEVTRFLNDSYFVSCNLPTPESILHWRSPEGKVIKSKKNRIHIEESPGKLVLVFEHIKLGDKGNWACEEENGGHKTSFQLFVIKRISFMDPSTTMSVKNGANATLRCEVTGDPLPKVSWHFNGKPIVASDKFKILEDGIHIRNVGTEDAGEYTCKAYQISKNVNDVQEHTILLKLKQKPKFIPNRNVNETFAYITGIANLTCETQAEPPANFTWYQGKNNKRIKTNYTVHTSPNLSNLQIRVDDSTAFDIYTCKADNGLGPIERKIELKEGFKPESPEAINLRGFNSNILIIDFGTLKPPSKNHTDMPVTGYVIQYNSEYEHKRNGLNWYHAQEKYVQFEEGATYIISQLESNTTYVMRAATRNLAGLSGWTKIEKFTTQSNEPPGNSANLNQLNLNIYQIIIILSTFSAIFNSNYFLKFNSILPKKLQTILVL